MTSMRIALQVGLCLLVVSGCTSVMSNRVLKESENIPFADLQRDPDRYRDALVILGGQIVQTIVREGETWVQVLQLPLAAQHRPDNAAAPGGRFWVIYRGFADPVIYAKGRQLTVAGEVLGRRTLSAEGREMAYPAIMERETHVWKPEEYPAYYDPGPRVGFGFGFGAVR